MKKRKPKALHKTNGRPTKITPEVIRKLEDCFRNAFTDEMACLYVDISTETLYAYCRKNQKFSERKELLKQSPNLTAQETLVGTVKTESGARWWAEHRMADFRPTSKVEHSGKIGLENVTVDPATLEAIKAYEEMRTEQIKKETKLMI